jgi:AcrR family transcriptional regulator
LRHLVSFRPKTRLKGLDIRSVSLYHLLVTNRLSIKRKPPSKTGNARKNTATQSLRERKKAQTRHAIQQHALRLFKEKGYDATTVEEIAAAAGVSHMTFFRYFPTKEDVVIEDDYDPLLMAMIKARPTGESPIEAIRQVIKQVAAKIYASDRDEILARMQLFIRVPALRARLVEHGSGTEQIFTQTIAVRMGCDENDIRPRVISAACIAAISVAIFAWADSPNTCEMPAMIDQALRVLQKELR